MRLKRLTSLAALFLAFSLIAPPPAPARAQAPGSKGAVILYTVPPRTVCVGDTFTIEGGSFLIEPDFPGDIPLAPLTVIGLAITASQGTVTPSTIAEAGNDLFFSFKYTAKSAGQETVRVTENKGVAFDQISFKVEQSCAYDVFLVTVMDFTAQVGDFTMRTLTNVAGTGQMKRVRSTEDALQGDGTWHLEENMLSQPPECVQWYMPPLLLSGPFELDGEITPQEDRLDVILAFKPRTGPPVYHGKSICVDADGSQTEGWGYIQSGGDESMAAKIQADFPTGGGSQQVELTGKGVQIVQSVGSLEYTANLTVIPH